MSEDDKLGWAKALVDRKAWVLHLGTDTIGRASKLYDGRGELYVSPVNNVPVSAPVLELDTGASHVADPSTFTELSESHVKFLAKVFAELDVAVKVVHAGTAGLVQPPTALMLMAAAFRSQAVQFDRARRNLLAGMQRRHDAAAKDPQEPNGSAS
jgi:hypothetical protein